MFNQPEIRVDENVVITDDTIFLEDILEDETLEEKMPVPLYNANTNAKSPIIYNF